MAEFAADLHEVTLGEGRRPIYEDPERFFALTFATPALRELVKDVAERLDGKSTKAVRQLELTYGGGKTHTLITLYHLFRDPAALSGVKTVQEFRQHVGAELPQAFPVSLCFDKIDVERGIDGVRAPDGETRSLKHPWSVLAFQLAGAEGLRAIHADGEDEERETPPADPLLARLLAIPQEQGRGTLILVDEALMYARGKAGMGQVWRERIVDFFQHLVQAVTKVDRSALVASLLASDQNKYDDLGLALQNDLFGVIRRQKEEGVQPVAKEDVAEVLRRRLFEPESLRDSGAHNAHVIGVVGALASLDPATKRRRSEEEERFRKSYPFHPDLGDVFYTRWTQLTAFQRTRGILRTLATALRDAESWDECPVIGPSALLAAPGTDEVSDAVADLAGISSSEKSEGSRTDWRTLLEKELQIARRVQGEVPALGRREAEQAVLAVFLHSQPVGHKANTPELVRMIGAGAPDTIDLDKALGGWRELSWFLDDADLDDDGAAGALPRSWRLGNRPNLKQMHDEACTQRVTDDAVEQRLKDEARRTRRLSEGARAAGAQVHTLPESPRDLGDNGEFRYAVLGPEAASESGRPSGVASRYLAETTGSDRPRVHRNVVVLAVPSRDGIAAARDAIRALLGWEDVQRQLAEHTVDPLQGERLRKRLEEARRRVPDTIRAAWCIVVTLNEAGETQAFRLPADGGPLFAQIKGDERSRIKETAVDAEALLPDGPYDLWQENDEARFVRELTRAFARNPRLPKFIKANIVADTIAQGIKRGLFVAELSRPDGSRRTWWREEPPRETMEDDQLQVVLPGKAALTELPGRLFAPGDNALPGLWESGSVTLGDLVAYFQGGHTVTVPREGYDEVETIPRCDAIVVREAAGAAVEQGLFWLTNGPTSLWNEPVPEDVLTDAAQLRARPERVPASSLAEDQLPGAWQEGSTNGADLTRALSHVRGEAMPWGLVRESIASGVDSRWLRTRDGDAEILHRAYRDAGRLVLERPSQEPGPGPAPDLATQTQPATNIEGHQIQDLADLVPDLIEVSAGYQLKFRVQVVLDDAPDDVRTKVDQLIEARLKPESSSPS
ncbi:MAG: DUF499 domain-containing protein [Immundisolibacterales bacterium]|nr:DUF499 domain-containing protein [Immundisolibacterales bacterium]